MIKPQNFMKYFLSLICLILAFQVFSIDPAKEYALTPEFYNTEYHEIKVETEDLCHLNTWIIEPEGDTYQGATIVIAGSDKGNMGNSTLLATQLAQQGFRVVTFDYRGFGDSTDFQFNEMNLYHDEFVKDFTTITDWCKKEYPNEKLGVMAFSMGTIVSTLAYEPGSFDFFIGESFITSPEVFQKRIKAEKNIDINIPASAFQYDAHLKKIHIPTLLFGGKFDKATTIEDSEKVTAQRENSYTLEFDGGHLEGARTLGLASYVAEITKFVSNETDKLYSIFSKKS